MRQVIVKACSLLWLFTICFTSPTSVIPLSKHIYLTVDNDGGNYYRGPGLLGSSIGSPSVIGGAGVIKISPYSIGGGKMQIGGLGSVIKTVGLLGDYDIPKCAFKAFINYDRPERVNSDICQLCQLGLVHQYNNNKKMFRQGDSGGGCAENNNAVGTSTDGVNVGGAGIGDASITSIGTAETGINGAGAAREGSGDVGGGLTGGGNFEGGITGVGGGLSGGALTSGGGIPGAEISGGSISRTGITGTGISDVRIPTESEFGSGANIGVTGSNTGVYSNNGARTTSNINTEAEAEEADYPGDKAYGRSSNNRQGGYAGMSGSYGQSTGPGGMFSGGSIAGATSIGGGSMAGGNIGGGGLSGGSIGGGTGIGGMTGMGGLFGPSLQGGTGIYGGGSLGVGGTGIYGGGGLNVGSTGGTTGIKGGAMFGGAATFGGGTGLYGGGGIHGMAGFSGGTSMYGRSRFDNNPDPYDNLVRLDVPDGYDNPDRYDNLDRYDTYNDRDIARIGRILGNLGEDMVLHGGIQKGGKHYGFGIGPKHKKPEKINNAVNRGRGIVGSLIGRSRLDEDDLNSIETGTDSAILEDDIENFGVSAGSHRQASEDSRELGYEHELPVEDFDALHEDSHPKFHDNDDTFSLDRTPQIYSFGLG